MYKISILIPTRGRAGKLQQLIENILSTSEEREFVEICFYVDQDDDDTAKTLSNLTFGEYKNSIKIRIGPKVIFSDLWNHLLPISTGDILMICGDDVEFKTKGWDSRIRKVFESFSKDKIGYVCVNDEIHRGALGVHGFVHRNWVDVLEYITPNMFVYWWADNWVDDIAKMVNRRVYLDDVIVAHRHWSNHTAAYDKTYQENQKKYEEANKDKAMEKLYGDTLPLREQAVTKLLTFMDTL